MYQLLLNWLLNDIFKINEITGEVTLFGYSFCDGSWVASTFQNQAFLQSICQVSATALTIGFVLLVLWFCYQIIKFLGGLLTL